MSKLSVLNTKGEKVNDITLSKEIWEIEPNDAVLYDAIKLSRNSLRQYSADTKTRSEVSGGGRKPWKQKGTGRARQGSTRSPQWYHGGVVFGPHPKTIESKMNRKERRIAIKSALAYKAIDNELIIIDKFDLDSSKTKDVKTILETLKANKNVLIVVDKLEDSMIYATRNLKNIILLQSNEINVLDVIAADNMIITEAAIKQIEEVLV